MIRRTALLIASAATITQAAGDRVREPILAGTWYPGDPTDLKKTVEGFLSGGSASAGRTIALIVPHAGYAYSGPTAGKGFAAVRGGSFDRVIVLGPSHHVAFDGGALPDDDAWETPLGRVPLDREAIATLTHRPGFRTLPVAHQSEHCIEIEVPFLQVALAPGFRLVPIVVGSLDDASCGQLAAGLTPLLGPRTLLVVSSDFTHYGPNYDYVPFRDSVSARLRAMDDEAIAAIRKISAADFESFRERTGSTICGAEPIRVLLTMLRDAKVRAEKLGYDQSGAQTGDFTNSVSYAAIAFTPAADPPGADSTKAAVRPLNAKEQGFLLKLARDAIMAELRAGSRPSTRVPDEFGPDSPLGEERGVFVTLTEGGDLRGCIGSIIGVEPLIEGVAHQAVNSATQDPRFTAVSPREMKDVRIEISVLTPPVPVAGPEEIDVGRHGVFLSKRGRHAVFLPQVATEQGWDRDTMLSQLCRKAGLGPDDWKSGASFEVFEAQIFEEEAKPD